MLTLRAPWVHDPETRTWRWDAQHYLVAQRGPGTQYSVWYGGSRLGSTSFGDEEFFALDAALDAAERDCYMRAVRQRATLLAGVERLDELMALLAGT